MNKDKGDPWVHENTGCDTPNYASSYRLDTGFG